jgi:hypothetical protein
MLRIKTRAGDDHGRSWRWAPMVLVGAMALGSIVAAAAMATEQGHEAVVGATGALGAGLQAVPRHLRTESDPKLVGGDNPRFQVQNVGESWNYSVVGDQARFEVRPGDSLPGDGKIKERSEIATSQKMKRGQPYEITFRFMVEPGPRNTAKWMTLTQIQATPDPGEPGHSPPFAIEMVGERMRIITRTDPNLLASRETTTYIDHYTDSRDIERGRWYRMLIRVKFDPSGEGFLQVFRDGDRLVDYHGALGFEDLVGPYWKEGVYRASSNESFAANYKGLKITAR